MKDYLEHNIVITNEETKKCFEKYDKDIKKLNGIKGTMMYFIIFFNRHHIFYIKNVKLVL